MAKSDFPPYETRTPPRVRHTRVPDINPYEQSFLKRAKAAEKDDDVLEELEAHRGFAEAGSTRRRLNRASAEQARKMYSEEAEWRRSQKKRKPSASAQAAALE